MPTIQGPKAAPEYVNGKNNQVIAVAPAQLLAVSWVDGEGKKGLSLVLQFGKDTEDKGPGVFIMADENEMITQLKLPNATIKKGVRQWLARQSDSTPDEVPETGAVVVAPKVTAKPAPAKPPVVPVGKIKGSPTVGNADITKIDV